MVQVFPRQEPDGRAFDGLPIAVLGYGSQGRAQALNVRDAGCEVRVGVRGGASWDRAKADGFAPATIEEAADGAALIVFCLPDVEMGRLFREQVAGRLKGGETLVFAHGFAIHYGLIDPPTGVDVVLVAPMGAGPVVRSRFEEGSGVPGLVAVHRDASGQALARALNYGAAIGCGRVALLSTTFAEETEADLFGEQAVLCGGLPWLIRNAYEVAVGSGVSPEVAYIACLHEVKLIADLLYTRGLDGMVENISGTAEWGAYEAGPRIIGAEARQGLEETMRRVQSGEFARDWLAEAERGGETLAKRRRAFLGHPMDDVGRQLRPLLGATPASSRPATAPPQKARG